MNNKKWMIYGANGYTGKLVAEKAKQRGYAPVLAGRKLDEVKAIADQYGFEYKAFDLNDVDAVAKNLEGFALVLHCAGPFSKTHKPMFDACLKSKTHYLDITGEIRIFERVQHKKTEIVNAGIVAIPGVGFDVVPTDCLANLLKAEMPDATHLCLGFQLDGGPSPGTLKTMVEGLPAGGVIRKDGKLTLVEAAHNVRQIRFKKYPAYAVTFPWGDLSTAYHSTGIPNIEVYVAMPKQTISMMRMVGHIRYLFALKPVQNFLQYMITKTRTGDDAQKRSTQKGYLWGEVTNAAGKKIEKRLQVPDGYELTADSALRSVQNVLTGNIPAGPWTPAQVFGADFILKCEGTSLVS